MQILVIGEGCKDVFQYGSCDRLAPEAPAPVFVPNDYTENQGMALNVKNNLLALKNEVVMITNENWAEVTKTRYIDKKSNHMIVRVDKNDKAFSRCNVKKIDFKKFDCVVISDYNKGFLLEEDIEYISKQCPLTFLDTKKILGKWAKNITYIKINNFEYSKNDNKTIMKLLKDKLIITLGSDGAKHKDITYSVEKVDIKDLSGAGDTFLAGLVHNFTRTKSISDAIKFANSCATEVVQQKGVSVVQSK
jgi:D-beta-D-heptose 7-phosphate kinase/D-beta-D-heptose 1-phosphate adenosyltransferase